MKLRFVFLGLLCVLPFQSAAHEYKVNDLIIDHPIAGPTTGPVGAGYMTVTNTGTTADRLLSIEADFPQVSLHESIVQNDIASMRAVESILILPGETVTFAPGGLHVMFMGLGGDPFEIGEKIPATLVFEQTGPVDVIFNVEGAEHQH